MAIKYFGKWIFPHFLVAIADLTHPLSNNRSSTRIIGCYLSISMVFHPFSRCRKLTGPHRLWPIYLYDASCRTRATPMEIIVIACQVWCRRACGYYLLLTGLTSITSESTAAVIFWCTAVVIVWCTRATSVLIICCSIAVAVLYYSSSSDPLLLFSSSTDSLLYLVLQQWWYSSVQQSVVCVCVCVFSSDSFWTSSSLDVPAGVTQEEDHTGFLIHLFSAVRALIFLARTIQPFLSLVDREVKFCVLTI